MPALAGRAPAGAARRRPGAGRSICATRSARARGGIDYDFAGEIAPGPELAALLPHEQLDELIVADSGLGEEQLLEIVDAAHRRGVSVRVAPRTTELLVERGEYVPGQGLPLFELRPPILAGADWAVKRAFDVVVAALIVVVAAPALGADRPAREARPRAGRSSTPIRGSASASSRSGCSSSARWSRAPSARQAALESANEASGALFKIRDDPRVTRVGRFLRRFSLDEVPNVINVLRGEMSLVGPRPLPLRDHAKLDPWHRRRTNVLPGMTGLWQIAGRSDLSFDDLVRLDFYYLENWSLWLDITILVKTLPAVVVQRGAY